MRKESRTDIGPTYPLLESDSYTATPDAFGIAGIYCMSADISDLDEEAGRTNQDAVGRAVEDVADLFGDDCHRGRKGSISSAERCRVLLSSACKQKVMIMRVMCSQYLTLLGLV